MHSSLLHDKVLQAYGEGRRLVAPLLGFPGLSITNCTIKLAQQNYGEHFKTLTAIAATFEPDVLFPLMDIAVEANALGRYTIFPQDEPTAVMHSGFSLDELPRLVEVDLACDTRIMGYVETMRLMSIGLPKEILKGAYVIGPYTLAGLMMGAEEAALATVLQPDVLDVLCRFATEKVRQYSRLLIAAGAQAVCILEPGAVVLGPQEFARFSASHVRRLAEMCRDASVAAIYHVCGNTMHLIERMVESGVDGLSLDSAHAGVDLEAAAQRVPPDVIVMGNISPTGCMLVGTPRDVETEVTELLKRMARYPNFVLSTGCDLPKETPQANIRVFMRAGRQYRLR